jgi:hypothetical protein
VPCLYIKNWPEDGSLEPKHVANCVLIDYINYFFTMITVITSSLTGPDISFSTLFEISSEDGDKTFMLPFHQDTWRRIPEYGDLHDQRCKIPKSQSVSIRYIQDVPRGMCQTSGGWSLC